MQPGLSTKEKLPPVMDQPGVKCDNGGRKARNPRLERQGWSKAASTRPPGTDTYRGPQTDAMDWNIRGKVRRP